MGRSKIIKRAIVTKGSNDGTFLEGDHITFYADGAIGCAEAAGFIPAEEVEEAVIGMEYKEDEEWVAYMKKQIEAIKSIIGETNE